MNTSHTPTIRFAHGTKKDEASVWKADLGAYWSDPRGIIGRSPMADEFDMLFFGGKPLDHGCVPPLRC
jgi:hypothetical protein